MNTIRSNESGRVSPIALIALAVLLIGLAAWASSWHALPKLPAFGAGAGSGASGSAAASDTSSDAVIDRALAIAGADSARMRAKWHDDVRGMDLASLDPKRREMFVRFANAERCTCGCGFSLAGCRASDMTCETSGPRLAALLDSVRSGSIRNANGLRAGP